MDIKYQEEINELIRMEKQCLGPQGCSMESMKRNSYKAHCLHVGIVGIKALQEQAEREKGCLVCNKGVKITYSPEDDLYPYAAEFCPHCGKRLK